MRDTNKGFMAVKVKKDTYDILKAMAIENKCTLAALIHEAVSKLKPDDAGNIYNKISSIEQYLKLLHGDYTLLSDRVSRINVSPIPGAFASVIPTQERTHLYLDDKDIKKRDKEAEARHKMHVQDEADRNAAIAAGEDVVERPRRRPGQIAHVIDQMINPSGMKIE